MLGYERRVGYDENNTPDNAIATRRRGHAIACSKRVVPHVLSSSLETNGIVTCALARFIARELRASVTEAETSEPVATSLFELRLAVARMHDCEASRDNAAMGPHDSAARRSAPAGGASGGIALVSTASDARRQG